MLQWDVPVGVPMDLFVPGHVHFEPSDRSELTGLCLFRGIKVMCGPCGLKGEPHHLFRNNVNGTFTDVSERAGVSDSSLYYGLASLFIDVNRDGGPGLLVANDSTPNYLYINKGDGTFQDDSYTSGLALNKSGRGIAAMGIGAGDLSHKGSVDICITTFSDDYNPRYRNDGVGNFTDTAYKEGIVELSTPFSAGMALFRIRQRRMAGRLRCQWPRLT